MATCDTCTEAGASWNTSTRLLLMTELCAACTGEGKHGCSQYLWHVQLLAAHSITNPPPAHDKRPPSVFRRNTLLSMGGAAVTWSKVNACRGMCPSIIKTRKGKGRKSWCCKCLFLYRWVHLCSLLLLAQRNQPADTQGQTSLTSPDFPLWPGVLISFPLMASVSALTLRCDSSLQQFHPQRTTGDLQLALLQSQLDHNCSSMLSTGLLLLHSFAASQFDSCTFLTWESDKNWPIWFKTKAA